MAVSVDDILKRGKGPLRTTFADRASSADVAVDSGQSADDDEQERTGVEDVRYDTVTMQGAPDNPKNARDVVSRGVVNVANTSRYADESATGSDRVTYTELYDLLSPNKPRSAEDIEKERKKQKREAIFAAIGDGISALSNLYFTTKYAPNAYNAPDGLAATTKARFDKLKEERERRDREYMEGYLRAKKMDEDAERVEREWEHTLERELVTDRYKEAAEVRAEAKAVRDAALAQLRMDIMAGKISEQQAAAEARRIQAEYADAYWRSRIWKNYRHPEGIKKYPVFDKNGDVVDHVYTPEEAISETERNGGTYIFLQKEQEQETGTGLAKKKTNTKTTQTSTGNRERRDDGLTMPGVAK